MKASALGMTGDSIRLDAHPDRQVRLVLSPSSESLGEVTVYGNARLTSLTENGLSYKMSANERAPDENTLQALGYVPLSRWTTMEKSPYNARPSTAFI